jgi:cellulose synthase/poly-beta-1,6-N-acetylglucosamine synthase-like glycosyltransferase
MGLLLILFHALIPSVYFVILSRRKLEEKGKLKDLPFISVIIPSYNEKDRINNKIKNVMESYPNDRMEILVVDSSEDGTYEKVMSGNYTNLILIRERQRRGKIVAVKEAMQRVKGEIIVMTDVDAIWNDPLESALRYLSGEIGGVTCVKTANRKDENSYRDFYNLIRVGESAVYSTPIFNGEMVAFKRGVVQPDEIPIVGADDSTIATLIALKGYRAIAIPTMRVVEDAPKKFLEYVSWKVRRGSHLVRHFTRNFVKVMRKGDPRFKVVFGLETYFHTVEPWLLVSGLILIGISNLYLLGVLFLLVALALLPKKTRSLLMAWAPNQIFLLISQLFALKGEVVVWRKEKK